MDLEEMKSIWENESGKKDFTLPGISDRTGLEFNKRMNNLQIGEVIGLLVAYALSGAILYYFNEFNNWYLQISGVILLLYFLIMPLYSISIVRKMRKPDLIRLNYKEVLEHFYRTRRKLEGAGKITFIANPFLFVSAMIIFTKICAGVDMFTLNFKWPLIIFIALAFIGGTLFNVWAFRKREKYLQSVAQLLEQDS